MPGAVLETWELAAVGPAWPAPPGEVVVSPVPGVLEVHTDCLVFRSADGRYEDVIPAAGIRTVGPLSPDSPNVGGWMPNWQRRLRCPGFVVGTDAGAWVFDGPGGPKRARAIGERFGVG